MDSIHIVTQTNPPKNMKAKHDVFPVELVLTPSFNPCIGQGIDHANAAADARRETHRLAALQMP